MSFGSRIRVFTVLHLLQYGFMIAVVICGSILLKQSGAFFLVVVYIVSEESFKKN